MTTTDIAVAQGPALEQLRSPEFLDRITSLMPEGTSPQRFISVAERAIREQPELAKATQKSLFAAFLRCAQDGLMPDRREATIAMFGNEAVYMQMIGGVRKKAGEYGWTIRAKAVYQADEFYFVDEPPMLRHTQARPGTERGPIIAAWAVATHRDGRREQLVMIEEDIAKRRALAQNEAVWKKWPAEQSEKTVAHALYDELPLASADRRLPRETDLESAVLMYGPAASSPALPARITGDDDEPRVVHTALDRPGGGEDDPPGSPPPSGDSEPEPETGGDDDFLAQDDASSFVPPNGKYAAGGEHGPLTLAQIAAENPGWFAWALRNVTDPPDFWSAIHAYARVYLPEQYQAEMTRRETTP